MSRTVTLAKASDLNIEPPPPCDHCDNHRYWAGGHVGWLCARCDSTCPRCGRQHRQACGGGSK